MRTSCRLLALVVMTLATGCAATDDAARPWWDLELFDDISALTAKSDSHGVDRRARDIDRSLDAHRAAGSLR